MRHDASSPRTRSELRQLPLSAMDLAFVLQLQHDMLGYFMDNQRAGGLVLDRQSNHGPLRSHGLCSIAATGMGFIALALAALPPYRRLSPAAAFDRIRSGLHTALEQLPHDRGILPHFIDSATGTIVGVDHFSTIDSAWLIAGALTAAELLDHSMLRHLAEQLADRVDWFYWSAPTVNDYQGLIRHGKRADGSFLPCSWDRLNGETVFMYVLAAGAREERLLPPQSWYALQPFYKTLAGHRFCSADLGLFVFQYGLDLLDLRRWRAPSPIDLLHESRVATEVNETFCRSLAAVYPTYRHCWGLSAGDGPGEQLDRDTYRCYAPSGPIDGTAHVTATLASIGHRPDAVLDNLRAAQRQDMICSRGRYGFSTINIGKRWASRDMVGIDAGAALLAVDNFLHTDRVRAAFHASAVVGTGIARLRFQPTAAAEVGQLRRAG